MDFDVPRISMRNLHNIFLNFYALLQLISDAVSAFPSRPTVRGLRPASRPGNRKRAQSLAACEKPLKLRPKLRISFPAESARKSIVPTATPSADCRRNAVQPLKTVVRIHHAAGKRRFASMEISEKFGPSKSHKTLERRAFQPAASIVF